METMYCKILLRLESIGNIHILSMESCAAAVMTAILIATPLSEATAHDTSLTRAEVADYIISILEDGRLPPAGEVDDFVLEPVNGPKYTWVGLLNNRVWRGLDRVVFLKNRHYVHVNNGSLQPAKIRFQGFNGDVLQFEWDTQVPPGQTIRVLNDAWLFHDSEHPPTKLVLSSEVDMTVDGLLLLSSSSTSNVGVATELSAHSINFRQLDCRDIANFRALCQDPTRATAWDFFIPRP